MSYHPSCFGGVCALVTCVLPAIAAMSPYVDAGRGTDSIRLEARLRPWESRPLYRLNQPLIMFTLSMESPVPLAARTASVTLSQPAPRLRRASPPQGSHLAV